MLMNTGYFLSYNNNNNKLSISEIINNIYYSIY